MFRFIEQKQINKELASTGISVGEIHDPLKSSPVLMCLIRALLIFLATAGTTYGFCACFNLPYDKLTITFFIVFISLFMGFLYLNKLTFYIGYVIMLGGFAIELIRYYLYANSGFQAIVNIIREEYSNHFDLNVMRQAEEYYENRYTTITIALYFLIVFLALLLNVTISRYMNLPETILVTFIFLEIPLYIGIIPPIQDLALLLTCYISVGLIRAGTHSRIVIGNKHSHEFIRFKWKSKRSYSYQGNVKSSILIIAFSFIFSTLILTIGSGIAHKTNTSEEPNAFKEKTDEYIKTLVQVGISGWFDRYSSVGGLSSGHLGGVSSVRPDFQTDLVVSFVPVSDKTMYLREFKGSFYTNNNWISDALEQNEDGSYNTLLTIDKIDEYDELAFENAIADTPAFGKMEIKNVDVAVNHYFLPYRTVFENIRYVDHHSTPANLVSTIPEDRRYPVFPKDKDLMLVYSPILDTDYTARTDNALKLYKEYRDYVMNSCRMVPASLDDYLVDFCKDKNYFGLDMTMNKADGHVYRYSESTYSDVNDFRLKACNAIYQMYLDEYPYTLSPGTTPRHEDFVQYFLEYQKRGFCAHFAASSVMILRHLGIPARYVEGYCIPASLIRENAVPLDKDASNWYFSPDFDSDIAKVVSVEVSDYYAHAWIEVYLDGYGFVPIEMTPPSYEAMPTPSTAGGLAGLFASLMSVDLDLNITGSGNTLTSNQDQVGASLPSLTSIDGSTILFPVGVVFMIAFVVMAVYFCIVLTAPRRKLSKSLKSGDYNRFIYIHFEELVKLLRKKELTDAENPLPMEVYGIISNKFNDLISEHSGDEKYIMQFKKFDDARLMAHFEFIEKILYSPIETDRLTCEHFADDMKEIKKLLKLK